MSRPTPTALKLIRGNPGHRPINRQEPSAPPAIPSPPKFLSRAARAEWRRHAPLLKDAGVLSHLDRDCLANLCQALARITEAEGELAKGGLTFTTPSGYIRPSPWLKIVESAVNTVTRLSVELGMTPSSRTRVKVDDKEWDEFDEFLARGPNGPNRPNR